MNLDVATFNFIFYLYRMKTQESKEEYDYLISKGFSIDWLDDMSGWWFTNYIETHYFGDVQINIEDYNGDGYIAVSTYDKTDSSGGLFDFIKCKYSREDLVKITNLLTD